MLKEGSFKYKEICEMLGWKPSTGEKRISQLKQLETMCEYYKKGHSIIITNINGHVAEEKFNVRKGKYNVEMASSILAVVTGLKNKIDNKFIYLSQRELILQTSLATEKLFNGFEAEGFSKGEVRDYKNVANKMSYNAIDSGLRWLQATRTLMYDRVKIAKIYNEEYEQYELRELDKHELIDLLQAEQIVLNQLGYESVNIVYIKGEVFDFTSKVVEVLKDEYLMDIEYYYSSIRFTITDLTEERGLRLLSKKVELKKELWEATHKALMDNAKARQKKFGSESKKCLEDHRNFKLKEGFDDEDKKFINVIYGYDDYINNFMELDKIYRL